MGRCGQWRCPLRAQAGEALSRPFGCGHGEGVFHLPWAQQEASAESRGFQKERLPARAAGASWCGCCAIPLCGTGELLPVLQGGTGSLPGEGRSWSCPGGWGSWRGLEKAGDTLGFTVLHLAEQVCA